MAKPIRIFRHIACEGPGYLLDILQRRQLPHQLISVDSGEVIAPLSRDVAGLVFMGGPMSVNDPLPWIADEIKLIQSAITQRIPVLGICLGSQLLAKALGARVYPGPCMELGWLPVQKTQPSAWTDAMAQTVNVFHWHGETFDLPDGAELLMRSDRFAHQAFAHGPHLGLQFHLEVTEPMINEWLQLNAADLVRRCYHAHDQHAIQAATPDNMADLHRLADQLFGRWLNHCYA